ncbi:hypothetical protein [Phyllobacterium sp. K27]
MPKILLNLRIEVLAAIGDQEQITLSMQRAGFSKAGIRRSHKRAQ